MSAPQAERSRGHQNHALRAIVSRARHRSRSAYRSNPAGSLSSMISVESPWVRWRLPSHLRRENGACDIGMTRRRRSGRCGCSSSAARSSLRSRGGRRCSSTKSDEEPESVAGKRRNTQPNRPTPGTRRSSSGGPAADGTASALVRGRAASWASCREWLRSAPTPKVKLHARENPRPRRGFCGGSCRTRTYNPLIERVAGACRSLGKHVGIVSVTRIVVATLSGVVPLWWSDSGLVIPHGVPPRCTYAYSVLTALPGSVRGPETRTVSRHWRARSRTDWSAA